MSGVLVWCPAMNNSNTTDNRTAATATGLHPLTHENKWHEFIHIFLCFAEAAIIITALVGNFLVVYVFIFYKKLRTRVTNYFVVSLAVSDILTSGFVTTFKLDSNIKANLWTHGEFICSLYTTMYLLAVPSSVINLCAVTVDRYLVLRMPLRYNSVMPPGRAVLIICCLWIYAVIWACLPVMGWKIDFPIIQNGYCHFVSTREYNVAVNIVNFLLPMIFMAIFWSFIYGIVLKHLERVINMEKNLSRNTSGSSNFSHLNGITQATRLSDFVPPRNERKKRMRRNVRGSRYIGFIVVLFYFCWLPYVTISMIGNLCQYCLEEQMIPFVIYDAFLVLGLLNSALNPFLYPFHDKHFKVAFRDMWKKMKSKLLVKNLCSGDRF